MKTREAGAWKTAAATMSVVAGLGLLVGVVAEQSEDPKPQVPDEAKQSVALRGFNQAVIVLVKGEINDVMYQSIKRRVDQARADDTRLIVFELDTPGGAVSSALDICALIKTIPDEIHTVAWVNPHAFSAGSMIALACKEIVVNSYSQIGDCQPIMVGPQGVQAIPDDVKAKFTAPVLTEFRDSAKKRGYDDLMCVAMIQPQIEVFWVEKRGPDGEVVERRFVDRAERDRLFAIDQPTQAPKTKTKTVVTKEQGQAGPVERVEREVIAEAKPRTDVVQSKSDWDYVTSVGDFKVTKNPIVASDELLTMTQDEAIAYGFAEAKVDNQDELAELYDIGGPIEKIEFSWSEKMVNWLTSPIVRGILMVLVMLGAYVEFNTPGVGVPGLVAVICLAIFLGAPYVTGLANMWEIVLVALGVVLIGVEVFVIPGFGIAGLAGIILMLVGLIATFVPEEPGRLPFTLPRFAVTWEGAITGLQVMASSMVASLVGAAALSRYFSHVPYVGKIVSPNPTVEDIAAGETYPRSAFVGEIGKAAGPLRPSGKAWFGETLVDVVSESDYIESGEPLEVVERYGNRVVVRRVQDA